MSFRSGSFLLCRSYKTRHGIIAEETLKSGNFALVGMHPGALFRMDYLGQKGIRGADLPSSLGSSTLHAFNCRHNPSRRCKAYRLQVRHSSTPWRIAQAPGDEESDELTLQACAHVSLNTSSQWFMDGLSRLKAISETLIFPSAL